jgi:hypothetical protein
VLDGAFLQHLDLRLEALKLFLVSFPRGSGAMLVGKSAQIPSLIARITMAVVSPG